MDQTISTLIAAGVPTLAVIASFVRNESALAALGARVSNLELRLDARIETLDRDIRARFETMNGRFETMNGRIETLDRDLRMKIETLDRDLRDWAKVIMQHNTDIARLKDKTGLE